MQDETIVAVYDTAAHADAAVKDLISAGISESSISRSGSQDVMAAPTAMDAQASPRREEGFWSRLFGGEPDHDTALYDRSVQSGSTVVTVRVTGGNAERVMDILDNHSPVDLEERASGYGMTQTQTTGVAAAAYAPTVPMGTAKVGTVATGDTIQLAEERLAVGKRLVNLGGTRIRRFVVETPVEEQVSLHSEKVTIDRRPVTDGRPVSDAAFTEKTIQMTEMAEEAVVAKTAVVTEEISLNKQATDRVETVRDTVRKEEVEIENLPADSTTTTTTTTSGTTTRPGYAAE